MKPLFVVNARGEREPFSFQKVERSAMMAGASEQAAHQIAHSIQKWARDNVKTGDIFRQVRKRLDKHHPSFALRFSLKQAMRALGPTGFPFEKYVASLLKSTGYGVKLSQYISGRCLNDYEIDFLAERDSILKFGECKYRNQAGACIDQEIALANYARFLDIKGGGFCEGKVKSGLTAKSILVTNTRFSERAVAYSECVGVELWGWKYPPNNGLEKFIDDKKLYPITILPSFRKHLFPFFIQSDLILARDVLEIDLKELAARSRLPLRDLQKMANEARGLFENI
ncbi:MAG: hypothetical protein PHU56_03225 [Candidatus Pacebacteria bacterium]|nr:hypothetical protein [Candidatus Paceibacterota bacterium]